MTNRTYEAVPTQTLGTTAAQLVQPNADSQITACSVDNHGANSAVAQFWVVADGDSAGDSNLIPSSVTLAPGESRQVTALLNQVIPLGSSLWGKADTANSINVKVSAFKVF